MLDKLLAVSPARRRAALESLTSAERALLDERLAEREAAKRLATYAGNPLGFVHQILSETTWSKQREVFEALKVHHRVAVPASHSVSKSHSAARAVAWWGSVHPPGTALVITCYTDDTEVLTRAGWKLFQDVKVGEDGDEFATRNPITREFEWQHGFRYVKAPYKGEVIDFKSRNGKGLHLRVTPNHRMLVEWQDQRATGEILKPAEEVGQRGARIPALSTWGGESPESLRFGRYQWTPAQFAAFLGMYLAEGNVGAVSKYTRRTDRKAPAGSNPPAGPINITQLPKTKGWTPFRDLLTEMIGRTPYLSSGKTWTFACSDLYHYLKPLGRSHEKYIPEEVKNWSTSDLRRLLDFYLLGDGWQTQPTSSGRRQWRAQTVSKRLADDLQEIAQKVGLAATIKQRPARRGGVIDGRQIEGRRPIYQIHFNESRCRAVVPSRTQYEGDVYCVSVPNEVLYVRREGKPTWCGNTAPTFRQVRNVLWPHIRRIRERHKLPGETNLTEWKISGELVAFGFSAADNDESAIQGYHSPNMLVIVDEAGGIGHTLGDALESVMTGENTRMLLIGNPPTDEEQSWFEKCCADPDFHVVRIAADDSPNLSGEETERCRACPPQSRAHSIATHLVDQAWVDRQIRRFGADSAFVEARVHARFPRGVADKVIPYSWVERATQNEHPDSGDEIRLGVDVAADGGDEFVIARVDGMTASVIHHSSGEANASQVVVAGVVKAKILEIEKAHPEAVACVKIDAIGIGRGTADLLRAWSAEGQFRAEIVPVNVSERPRGSKDRFVNQRAEMWWNGRELLQPDEATGAQTVRLDVDEDTLAQLSGPKYATDSAGRISIESKASMKRRGIPSPDRAEAVLLALFEPVRKKVKAVAAVGPTQANTWKL